MHEQREHGTTADALLIILSIGLLVAIVVKWPIYNTNLLLLHMIGGGLLPMKIKYLF